MAPAISLDLVFCHISVVNEDIWFKSGTQISICVPIWTKYLH